MEEKERTNLFWQSIKQKRLIYIIADVFPFYLAWIASSFLMIDRKIGRTGAVILCGFIAFVEF